MNTYLKKVGWTCPPQSTPWRRPCLKSELFKPVLLEVLFTSWPRQARFRCLLICYCQKSSPPRTDLSSQPQFGLLTPRRRVYVHCTFHSDERKRDNKTANNNNDSRAIYCSMLTFGLHRSTGAKR